MKKIAVILSGCGVYDGTEIHESVLTLLHLSLKGISYQCFAPDIPQLHVINHLTGQEQAESRNVLVESARIARGEIRPLSDLHANEFHAVIIPGGFGAAKNLCDFAIKGAAAQVLPELKQALQGFFSAGKPVGFICIAPAIIPLVYPGAATLTIGTDVSTADTIQQLGGVHVNCRVTDIVIDHQAKIVSTPAYMLAQSIAEANEGIEKLVAAVIAMTAA